MEFSEVVEASEKDSEVLALKAALVSGRWHENLLLKPFRLIKDELMFKGGIILRREKLFIPKELRGQFSQESLGNIKDQGNAQRKSVVAHVRSRC